MEVLFYILEGVVLAAMTWLYVDAGKRWLPWVTGATAVVFAVLAFHRARHPLPHSEA